MKTESEQLWYTWSNKGFGDTGFQIRAVSPGFLRDNGANNEDDKDGAHPLTVTDGNLDDTRMQTILHYVHYTLPAGTIASEIAPEQAPISLAYLHARGETLLLHKAFIGSASSNQADSASNASIYFSHVLADLPPQADLPFTAREAINLWESPSWKTRDTLTPDEKILPRVTFSFAQPQSISATLPPLAVVWFEAPV